MVDFGKLREKAKERETMDYDTLDLTSLDGMETAIEESNRPQFEPGFYLAYIQGAEPYIGDDKGKGKSVNLLFNFMVNMETYAPKFGELIFEWIPTENLKEFAMYAFLGYKDEEGKTVPPVNQKKSQKAGYQIREWGFSAVNALKALGDTGFHPANYINRVVVVRVDLEEYNGRMLGKVSNMYPTDGEPRTLENFPIASGDNSSDF